MGAYLAKELHTAPHVLHEASERDRTLLLSLVSCLDLPFVLRKPRPLRGNCEHEHEHGRVRHTLMPM